MIKTTFNIGELLYTDRIVFVSTVLRGLVGRTAAADIGRVQQRRFELRLGLWRRRRCRRRITLWRPPRRRQPYHVGHARRRVRGIRERCRVQVEGGLCAQARLHRTSGADGNRQAGPRTHAGPTVSRKLIYI